MENYLKVYRALHHLTQAQLAEKLGVSRANISAIEKGHYDPSLRLAFHLAHFFEVSIEDLFLYKDELKPGPYSKDGDI
ncbi:MAG TPA: helix-turn-helix transcriptional regulator [Syntrophomonadaceae bacterium]|nr:helix-turn-helix transcriptional regulator [Syntrophomonadaceae bacterium]